MSPLSRSTISNKINTKCRNRCKTKIRCFNLTNSSHSRSKSSIRKHLNFKKQNQRWIETPSKTFKTIQFQNLKWLISLWTNHKISHSQMTWPSLPYHLRKLTLKVNLTLRTSLGKCLDKTLILSNLPLTSWIRTLIKSKKKIDSTRQWSSSTS